MVAPTDGGEPAHLRATRDGYDAIAVGYAERFRAELDARPLDRALLGAFAELVRSDGGGARDRHAQVLGGCHRLLRKAGFGVDARLVREPDEAEKVPQAYLLARRAPET